MSKQPLCVHVAVKVSENLTFELSHEQELRKSSSEDVCYDDHCLGEFPLLSRDILLPLVLSTRQEVLESSVIVTRDEP